MLTKNDCILLLTELQDKGINVDEQLNNLFKSSSIPLEVLKFINDNKQLDVVNFYELLRKNSNHKKSPLYKNIVKEIDDPQRVLTTLAALQLQILLYGEKIEDKINFYKFVRADELSKVLNNYFINYDITNCLNLLKFYKADIKSLESIK